MLLDSNTIIYAALPEHESLRKFLTQQIYFVSAISYVEVLGYHQLTAANKEYFKAFFHNTTTLPVCEKVIQKASSLRQQKKMSLGDAIVAATALVHDLTLVTHNIKDFEWIEELSMLDPLAIKES